MGLYWLWFLLIGLLAGWLGSLIVKGGGSGLLTNLIIGVIGSLLGGWLFRLAGLSSGGSMLGSLITAVAGAVVLLLIVQLFRRKGV